MSRYQFFLVMLNLKSKFFRNFLIIEHSGLSIFQRGCLGTNFFGPAKFEFTNFSEFFIYRVLCTLNSSGKGDLGTNCFRSCLIWGQNFLVISLLQSTVDSEFFRGGVRAPTLFGHTKFFRIFSFTEHSRLWIVQERGSGNELFLVMLNLR